MTYLNPDDAEIITRAGQLQKAGVPAPHPDSPDGQRLAGALERERSRFTPERILKAKIAKAGIGSDLHEQTARGALARGERGWTAADRLINSPGLMGGEIPRDGKPASYDPRHPDSYFEDEAVDQMVRAQIGSEMAKAGNDRMLAHLRLTETARRDPMIAAAVDRAERKAAKKGRKPTERDFRKAYRKLTAGRAPAAKGALGGLVPNVVDLTVPKVRL